MNNDVLEIYTVYYSPLDYPGVYVVRKFSIGASNAQPIPDKEIFMASENFEHIRHRMENQMGKFFLNRDAADDPVIVGSFI